MIERLIISDERRWAGEMVAVVSVAVVAVAVVIVKKGMGVVKDGGVAGIGGDINWRIDADMLITFLKKEGVLGVGRDKEGGM